MQEELEKGENKEDDNYFYENVVRTLTWLPCYYYQNNLCWEYNPGFCSGTCWNPCSHTHTHRHTEKKKRCVLEAACEEGRDFLRLRRRHSHLLFIFARVAHGRISEWFLFHQSEQKDGILYEGLMKILSLINWSVGVFWAGQRAPHVNSQNVYLSRSEMFFFLFLHCLISGWFCIFVVAKGFYLLLFTFPKT